MNPLLVITTSHGSIGTSGKCTGLWLEEFVGVYVRFMNRGIPVIVASPRGGKIPIDPLSLKVSALSPEARAFIAHRDQILNNTINLHNIRANDFDAVFYPGGHGPMWDLAEDFTNARILGSFFNCGKVVGAVCHGPAALLKARLRNGYPVISNRKITACSDAEECHCNIKHLLPFSLEDKLRNTGGIYSNQPPWTQHVVRDGNLVTGQNVQSTAMVAETMLNLLIPSPLMVLHETMA